MPVRLNRRCFGQLTAIAAAITLLGNWTKKVLAQASSPVPTDAINVALQVNGTLHALSIEPRVTLLDALREYLGSTGTKKGCNHGQCGACTVLVDGQRVLNQDPPNHLKYLGVKNFCLWVDDMDTIMRELRAQNVKFVWEALTLPEVGTRVTMIRDNNENLIALWERRGRVWQELGRP